MYIFVVKTVTFTNLFLFSTMFKFWRKRGETTEKTTLLDEEEDLTALDDYSLEEYIRSSYDIIAPTKYPVRMESSTKKRETVHVTEADGKAAKVVNGTHYMHAPEEFRALVNATKRDYRTYSLE
eukprot:maker-scaffold_38-snap-gene-2.25-mRNA-1 protein AED:0.03 eAED:0.03 QI:0/1/0.5/1/1/1/2/393/123